MNTSSFVILASLTALWSLTSNAEDCEIVTSKKLNARGAELCKNGAEEILSTGGLFPPSKTSEPRKTDPYGFYVRCKNGESFMGVYNVKLAAKTCAVQIERTARLEMIAPLNAAVDGLPNCEFAKVQLTAEGNDSSSVQLAPDLKIVVAEAEFKVERKGRSTCTFNGGIYSNFYFSQARKTLMTEEYSGSCGANRVFNLETCKEVGAPAKYCGGISLENALLKSPPVCESTSADTSKGYCSSAHVYRIAPTTCELSLDEKASRALTKEVIGIELPDFDKGFDISGKGTPNAKIEKRSSDAH